MRKLPRYLYVFSLLFLTPYYAGLLGRWVTYSYTGDPRASLMFWTALAAACLGLLVSKFWPAKPEAGA